MEHVNPFDHYATVYDDWFENRGEVVFDIEVRAFRQVLDILPEPWIEIGVGSGRFASALGITTGLDSSIKMLEIAAGRGIRTYLASAEKQPFASSSFGTAFLIVTLCFIKTPSAALQEIRRILMPGGKLVVGIVPKGSPWGNFYKQQKAKHHPLYKHAIFYSYDELAKILTDTGFAIEQTVSTLFQKPGRVSHMEKPQTGFFPDAGFTIVVAGSNKQLGHLREGQG